MRLGLRLQLTRDNAHATKDPAAQEQITPSGALSSCQVTISVEKTASVVAVEGRDKEGKEQPHVAAKERSASSSAAATKADRSKAGTTFQYQTSSILLLALRL